MLANTASALNSSQSISTRKQTTNYCSRINIPCDILKNSQEILPIERVIENCQFNTASNDCRTKTSLNLESLYEEARVGEKSDIPAGQYQQINSSSHNETVRIPNHELTPHASEGL